MKKFLIILVVFCISFSFVNAYTISEFEEKRNSYKDLIEKKVGKKLQNLSESKSQALLKKIENMIVKYENNTRISDKKKLKNLAILFALKGVLLQNQSSVDEQVEEVSEDIEITVIDDKRCNTCQTDEIITQLKNIETLSDVKYIMKDFGDDGVKEYMKKNNIKRLPAIIFNRSDVEGGIAPYFLELNSGEFSLSIDAKFDPFIERSQRGYKMVSDQMIDSIKKGSYIKGNKDAKITILEYSDIECPFCARLHTQGTLTKLADHYGNDINFIYNHFPLSFHANAQPGAEILECVAELKGTESFYNVMEKSFSEGKSTKEYLIYLGVQEGVTESLLKGCLESGRYNQKVKDQMNVGIDIFGIRGTPGNIIINNKTGEYELLSGAYPYESFKEIIEKIK